MSDQSTQQMPQPTAEHKKLKELVGTWKVACKFYMEPGQPPMETEAKETVEMNGEFWAICKFESNMMGMPFTGRSVMGFEPDTGKYVSTWIDSMSPSLCVFRGSQKGDTLTMEGEFFSCMTNSVLKHRITEKQVGKNERVFEMFATMPDGNEIKMMTNHYRRA